MPRRIALKQRQRHYFGHLPDSSSDEDCSAARKVRRLINQVTRTTAVTNTETPELEDAGESDAPSDSEVILPTLLHQRVHEDSYASESSNGSFVFKCRHTRGDVQGPSTQMSDHDDDDVLNGNA